MVSCSLRRRSGCLSRTAEAEQLLLYLAVCLSVWHGSQAKQVTLHNSTRHALVANASIFLPNSSYGIGFLDPFTGPKNPYGLVPFQNLSCTFLEPDCADPE